MGEQGIANGIMFFKQGKLNDMTEAIILPVSFIDNLNKINNLHVVLKFLAKPNPVVAFGNLFIYLCDMNNKIRKSARDKSKSEKKRENKGKGRYLVVVFFVCLFVFCSFVCFFIKLLV